MFLNALPVGPEVVWQRLPFIADAMLICLGHCLGSPTELACEPFLLAGAGGFVSRNGRASVLEEAPFSIPSTPPKHRPITRNLTS